MSLPFVWRKVLRESEVGSTAKLVGFVLATYMNSEGLTWPSRETIAAAASLSVRATDSAIRTLEEAGLLSVRRDWRGGRSKVNKYLALIPASAHPVRIAEAERAKRDRRLPKASANGKHQRANATAHTAQDVRPKKNNVKAAGDPIAAPPGTLDYCLDCQTQHLLSALDLSSGCCAACLANQAAVE